jgi:dienelactone hydrolase
MKRVYLDIILILLLCLVFVSKSFGAEIHILEYGNEKVQLDIYNAGRARSPVVILIHGAAGIKGDRAVRYKGFATDLMKEGIIAINVHYFDSNKRNWVKTIIKTIDYAQTINNADRAKIGLVGYSLGGTLALQAASRDERVKLLVINAGYLPWGFTKKDARRLPETYALAGTADSAIDTLRALKEWFAEMNKPFKAKIDEGYGHSIPISLFQENWKSIVLFLVERFGL